MAHDSFQYTFSNDINLAIIMTLKRYALFKHPRKTPHTSKMLSTFDSSCLLLPSREQKDLSAQFRSNACFLQSQEGSDEAEGIEAAPVGFREAKRVRKRKHSSGEMREEKMSS